ncbi:MAG TPA: hypothetical protein VMV19_18225 [Xanthobacteraceae bacterium]|nr:hypothetical protein [Xanthobacteraceae bacterium]
MAIQSGKKNAPFKVNKTPPPKVLAKSGGEGYGQAQYSGASSDVPGAATMSEMAANMKSSVDDDGVLDAVIAKGTSKSTAGFAAEVDGETSDQLRAISDKNVPNAHGMTSQTDGADNIGRNSIIPAKIGADSADPVRRPGGK